MSQEDPADRNLSAITCAFCLGDATRIAGAFLGHYKKAFRAREVADRFVEFGVHYADVVTHLADAAADALGSPRLAEVAPEYIGVGEEEGMWVERLPCAWVTMIASVPPDQAPDVLRRWVALSQDSYEADPEPWENPALLAALRDLIGITRESMSRGKPLLGLSAV